MFLQNTCWHEFWLFFIHVSFSQHQFLQMVFFKSLFLFKPCYFCMNFHTVSCFDHGYSIMHLLLSPFEFYHPFMNFHVSYSYFYFKEILLILNCTEKFTKWICVIFDVCERKRNDYLVNSIATANMC